MSVGETHGYNVPFTQMKIQKCYENAATHDIDSNALSCKIACHAYSKIKDKPGKVANSARSQLNRENKCFPIPVYA